MQPHPMTFGMIRGGAQAQLSVICSHCAASQAQAAQFAFRPKEDTCGGSIFFLEVGHLYSPAHKVPELTCRPKNCRIQVPTII